METTRHIPEILICGEFDGLPFFEKRVTILFWE